MTDSGRIAAVMRRKLNGQDELWELLPERAVGFKVEPVSQHEFKVSITFHHEIYKEFQHGTG